MRAQVGWGFFFPTGWFRVYFIVKFSPIMLDSQVYIDIYMEI